jgi:ATP-dependent Clp protease ATP-binding subunit ClpC
MSARPYTSRAQRALALADGEAQTLGHAYIGTEHLLLGLLEEKTGPAAQILNHLGVTVDAVRHHVQRILAGSSQ